ncbi:unnamed protein product [Mytilus coruscus]|uniref:Uncharacterized protein n=1 Tax=Mytilus coruscus TaxID=42192 RepID=A0A6J7ZVL6_MYTCO|nr:unnamed protein product [Mytilus coruscus]
MPPRGRGGRGRGKKYMRKIPITLPDNDSDVASNTEYDANINTQEEIPPQGHLRDWNTKLHSSRSGDESKDLTDREKWVMDRFKFLKTNIRHRRAPIKSVQEALSVARGDLDEAERKAAEDRLAIISADESIEEGQNTDADVPIPKTKKQKKAIDDPILKEVRKQFAEAQEDLRSVKSALSVAEPVTEKTTFLDWVREVCKNVSDDQFCEFQTSFIQLQNRWKQQRKQQTFSNSFTFRPFRNS